MTSQSSLDKLLNQLTGGNDKAAEIAAVMIGDHGHDAVKPLTDLIQLKDTDTRWWAVRALAEIKSDDLSQQFKQALKDPHPEVRQCAALALRENPQPGVMDDLIALLGSQDNLLARLAADALIAIGKPATPALIDAVKSDHAQSRLEAVRALAQIQDYDAVPTLFHLLDDDSALIAHWADQGLEKLGIGMVFFDPS